jgi:hypothetical protein
MGRVEVDHIKRLITLTSDIIKRLSLYFLFIWISNTGERKNQQQQQKQQQQFSFIFFSAFIFY